ncbi:DUF4268 domain-containing protein [Candidatus Thiodiazotropha endoloripes]|uniref:DUF4268 domain-containing protein n=1 Tax=Candidatus Thiodiazotropha endoloripes TaxID=1818881 RepID=A0A1E2UTF1_9GAMM|nr:DUF4268 domain-containing protein [Candidatus Thiodiazotropha endoloripes]MCG7983785.1 DUF4268 domain-containing protein [Candidatus Thiodiazotropha lotti]ODB98039.1 hypothetical protein A3196_15500 [Candidatus Thiodiazotropha endoloripes]
MTTNSLGRLEKVDLRNFWSSEAGDFTPWLAQDENISLLGEAVGLELEVEAQEKSVGPFRADILCKDTSTDQWVLIENQLERTDHVHLGQLLTYGAGLNAVTIVWIAAKFTEEHRAALDWLNEITDERFNFFGLEVELWRIGDSNAAPKFNIISKPNEWTRSVSGAAKNAGQAELSEGKQTQRQFWIGFKEYLSSIETPISATKPLPQHWMNLQLGRSGTKLTAVASFYNNQLQTYDIGEIRAQVDLFDKDAKSFYALLLAQKDEIEQEIHENLTWHNPESANACRIYLSMQANLNEQNNWTDYYNWLNVKLKLLRNTFRERVRQIDPSDIDNGPQAN